MWPHSCTFFPSCSINCSSWCSSSYEFLVFLFSFILYSSQSAPWSTSRIFKKRKNLCPSFRSLGCLRFFDRFFLQLSEFKTKNTSFSLAQLFISFCPSNNSLFSFSLSPSPSFSTHYTSGVDSFPVFYSFFS